MGKCNSKEITAQQVPTFVTAHDESDITLGSKTTTAESIHAERKTVKSVSAQATAVNSKNSNGVIPLASKSQFLAQISAPSSLDTEQLTTVYRVPNDRYESADAVLKERGLELLDMIDEGGFAKVYKARKHGHDHPVNGSLMACKMVDIGKDLADNAKLADVKNELFVLEKVKHPHIVRLYEHFIVNEYLYIFMDYADFGNLYRYMYMRQGPLAEPDATKPLAQIVSGIAYMHAKKIAHRDLKLSNILLKTIAPGNIIVLIADFGLSRVVYRRKTGLLSCKSYCGTPNYMAPELKQRSRYNAFEVDLYAIGVMLFVLVQAAYPFDAEDDEKALQQALKLDVQWLQPFPLSEQCRKLVLALLEPNSAKRMSMSQLIVDPWLAEQMALMKNALPSLESLSTKKTCSGATATAAVRRLSSPGDDIRLRKHDFRRNDRSKSDNRVVTKSKTNSPGDRSRTTRKKSSGGGKRSSNTKSAENSRSTRKSVGGGFRRGSKESVSKTRSPNKQRAVVRGASNPKTVISHLSCSIPKVDMTKQK